MITDHDKTDNNNSGFLYSVWVCQNWHGAPQEPSIYNASIHMWHLYRLLVSVCYTVAYKSMPTLYQGNIIPGCVPQICSICTFFMLKFYPVVFSKYHKRMMERCGNERFFLWIWTLKKERKPLASWKATNESIKLRGFSNGNKQVIHQRIKVCERGGRDGGLREREKSVGVGDSDGGEWRKETNSNEHLPKQTVSVKRCHDF